MNLAKIQHLAFLVSSCMLECTTVQYVSVTIETVM